MAFTPDVISNIRHIFGRKQQPTPKLTTEAEAYLMGIAADRFDPIQDGTVAMTLHQLDDLDHFVGLFPNDRRERVQIFQERSLSQGLAKRVIAGDGSLPRGEHETRYTLKKEANRKIERLAKFINDQIAAAKIPTSDNEDIHAYRLCYQDSQRPEFLRVSTDSTGKIEIHFKQKGNARNKVVDAEISGSFGWFSVTEQEVDADGNSIPDTGITHSVGIKSNINTDTLSAIQYLEGRVQEHLPHLLAEANEHQAAKNRRISQ